MDRNQQSQLFAHFNKGCIIKMKGVGRKVMLKKHGSGMVTARIFFAKRVGARTSKSISLDNVAVEDIKVYQPMDSWLSTTNPEVLAYWRDDKEPETKPVVVLDYASKD